MRILFIIHQSKLVNNEVHHYKKGFQAIIQVCSSNNKK